MTAIEVISDSTRNTPAGADGLSRSIYWDIYHHGKVGVDSTFVATVILRLEKLHGRQRDRREKDDSHLEFAHFRSFSLATGGKELMSTCGSRGLLESTEPRVITQAAGVGGAGEVQGRAGQSQTLTKIPGSQPTRSFRGARGCVTAEC